MADDQENVQQAASSPESSQQASTPGVVINMPQQRAQPAARSILRRGPKSAQDLVDKLHTENRGELDGWKVVVCRTQPVYQPIEDHPQGPWSDLVNFLKDCHGPGVYRVDVRDGNGVILGSKQQTILNRADPRSILAAAQAGGADGFIGSDEVAKAHSELTKTKLRKETAKAEKEATKEEQELEDLKSAREKEKEREATKAERQAMDATDKMLTAMKEQQQTMLALIEKQREDDKHREEQRDAREEIRRRDEREFQKGLFESLAARNDLSPQKSIGEQLLPVVSALQPVFAAITTHLLNGKPKEPQQDPLTVAIKLAELQTTQSDKKQAHELVLLDKLLDSKLNQPQDNMAAIRDAEERSEQRMMWMWEQLERTKKDSREDESDDDLNLDPNNLVGSGVVALIRGLYALLKSGGPVIAQAIADQVQKPADQIAPQDLQPLANRLLALPRPGQRQLPMMQNPPQRRAVQQPQQPGTLPLPPLPPPMNWQSLETLPNGGVQSPPTTPGHPSPVAQVSSAATISAPQPSLLQTMMVPPVMAQSTVAAEPVPEAAVTPEDMAEDMRQEMELTVKEAIIDCRAEREHTWQDNAYRHWHKSLKDDFAKVGEDATRSDEPFWWQIAKMKEMVDVKLWAELEPFIVPGTTGGYNFRLAMRQLVDALQGKLIVTQPETLPQAPPVQAAEPNQLPLVPPLPLTQPAA